MTRIWCMILVAISIVIVVVSLIYIYRNKIEHFYQSNNAQSNFVATTLSHSLPLSCISGYVDNFGTPHLFATALFDDKYKLLKNHYGQFQLLNEITNKYENPDNYSEDSVAKLSVLNGEGIFYQIDTRVNKKNQLGFISSSKATSDSENEGYLIIK